MLEVVNPLNRKPEDMETAAYRCACACYTGTSYDGTRFWASLPITSDCGCNCASGNNANDNANWQAAYNAS